MAETPVSNMRKIPCSSIEGKNCHSIKELSWCIEQFCPQNCKRRPAGLAQSPPRNCQAEIAAMLVWWPSIDKEIEAVAKKCLRCSRESMPSRVPSHVWKISGGPWCRIRIDFAGTFFGKMFIVVDLCSNWLVMTCVAPCWSWRFFMGYSQKMAFQNVLSPTLDVS